MVATLVVEKLVESLRCSPQTNVTLLNTQKINKERKKKKKERPREITTNCSA